MKELKQTNKIFIAGIVFMVILLVGLLTFRKPSLPYQMTDKEAIKLIGDTTKMLSVKNLDAGHYQWIDVRNQFEYANGHIDNATNIYSADLFEPFSIRYFKQLQKDGKKVILYGKDIHEASNPWMILAQLGFDNIFYLKEGYDGYQAFQSKETFAFREPEQPALNYGQFFVDAREKMKAEVAAWLAAETAAKKKAEVAGRAAIAKKAAAAAAANLIIKDAPKAPTSPNAEPGPVRKRKRVVKIRKKKKRKAGGC